MSEEQYGHTNGAVMAISIGSNSADKYGNILAALAWLRSTFNEVRCSSVYLTPPLSGVGEDYCNAVAMCLTRPQDTPETVTMMLKEYETAHGRTEHIVTIDLDLVIYNGDILRPKDFQRGYFQRGYMEILR